MTKNFLGISPRLKDTNQESVLTIFEEENAYGLLSFKTDSVYTVESIDETSNVFLLMIDVFREC